ncbi:MAG: hypothetical protein ACYC91_15345 [Solirubrobacteraceae bacterium]
MIGAVLLAQILILALASTALAAGEDWGGIVGKYPPPTECSPTPSTGPQCHSQAATLSGQPAKLHQRHRGFDCAGQPHCDFTITVSPHIVRVGDILTVTIDGGAGPGPIPAPSFTADTGPNGTSDCAGTLPTVCHFRAIAPSNVDTAQANGPGNEFFIGQIPVASSGPPSYVMLDFIGPNSEDATDYYAILPKSGFRLSGHVTLGCAGARVCHQDALEGVHVRIHGQTTHKTFVAATGSDGQYEIFAPKDTYTVVPKLAGFKFTASQRVVHLSRDVAGANFRGCPRFGSGPRVSAHEAAASTRTYEGISSNCHNAVRVKYLSAGTFVVFWRGVERCRTPGQFGGFRVFYTGLHDFLPSKRVDKSTPGFRLQKSGSSALTFEFALGDGFRFTGSLTSSKGTVSTLPFPVDAEPNCVAGFDRLPLKRVG